MIVSMKRLNKIGRIRRRRAMVEAEARPWPDFERAESHRTEEDLAIEAQKRIIRREIEDGVRPQVEQLESEGGPPFKERQ